MKSQSLNQDKIPFNKPFLTGKETHYMYQAVLNGKISGNGEFTKKCQNFFKKEYGFKKCLLTTSCTDALEMCAMLIDVQPGDEIIVPSYTFVSTALAFVRQGAQLVFADSRSDHPGIDEKSIEKLVTPSTKAIVPVHYAGVACDMKVIMEVANKYQLFVIEDAAQAIDSYYIESKKNRKALGTIGHLSAFSFHETKNIISGEGGMLCINDEQFVERAEIIWEKGTNRAKFFRGEIDKYGWVDTGSSFLPSEIIAAFLWAQLEELDNIQSKRKTIWKAYYQELSKYTTINFRLPVIPEYATNNAHMFYLICKNVDFRSQLIKFLKEHNVLSVFHYQSLNKSPYYRKLNDTIQDLPNCDMYNDNLIRLPFYYELNTDEVKYICSLVYEFDTKY